MQRERGLAGSPPSFAESPLAAIWERASDGHALAAGNIACIREARREVEARRGRRAPLGGDVFPDGFWAEFGQPEAPERGSRVA